MDNSVYFSPEIAPMPQSASKRLIDAGMLHYESSVAGYNERYHRGETSHTIHVWWARRPHSAMRSLIFSSLCKDTSDTATGVMSNLAMNGAEEDISAAKAILAEGYEKAPRVLDMFGGGGTIPFEAKKLGLDSYSIDANQLSVFIQRCNMLYADRVDIAKASAVVEETGVKILSSLKNKTAWLYPLRSQSDERTFGYMWTYETTCPHCNHSFLLMKRPWLSKKNGKNLCFKAVDGGDHDEVVLGVSYDETQFQPHWERRTGILHCPKCKMLLEKPDIKLCKDTMLAVITSKETRGKDFTIVKQELAIPSDLKLKAEEQRILDKLNATLPASELPCWSGVVNPALYGVSTHADFLNQRQRVVLLYLIDALVEEYDCLHKEDENLAKFVIGVLSSLMDQIIDWNCRLSMWIPQNEQVGRAFCGPGIAMLWDYVESDQLLHGPANLWDKLKRIVQGVRSFEGSE